MNTPKINDFVGERYIRSNREAHRRRATRIDPPMASLYVGIHRPLDWPDTFPEFFRALLNAINSGPPGGSRHRANQVVINELVSATIGHFATKAARDHIGDSEPSDASTSLTRVLTDPLWKRSKWRVEATRDFVAVTLHTGLDIQTSSDGPLTVELAYCDDLGPDQNAGLSRQFPLNDAGVVGSAGGLCQFLFSDLCTILQSRFDPIFAAIPKHYRSREDLTDIVFAQIYGLSVPWTLIRSAAEDDGPHDLAAAFPKIDEPRMAGSALAAARRQTNRFLTRYWDIFEKGLLSKETSDSVACYVLGGHGVYVSSLGSDAGDKRAPLKYLLMYQDPGLAPTSRADSSIPLPSSLRSWDVDRSYNFAWRISRFTSRIVDIGSARLLALSHYKVLSEFLQEARDLEIELRPTHPGWEAKELRGIEKHFVGLTKPNEIPITLRASLVRYSRDVIVNLLPDLDIISLPTFQPYDQFIRRRILGTLDRMISAGDRYDTLQKKINSANISHQSGEILRIQRIADWVGLLIFTYYSMQLAKYVAETAIYRKLAPASIFGLSISPTVTEIGLMAGVAAGVAFFVITNFERVRRAIHGLRQRPSRRKRRSRSNKRRRQTR